MALLEMKNLTVEFPTLSGPFKAVDGVDLEVDAGEVVAIVGEFRLGQERAHARGHGAAALDRPGHAPTAWPSPGRTCWGCRPATGAGSSARTWR